MHGKVEASDELEYVGYQIEHGSFNVILEGKVDKIHLNPRYTDIFNKLFQAKFGGPPVKYEPHPPAILDLKEELEKQRIEHREMLFATPQLRTIKKQGRNEPCACGSGKKYKQCCGRR